MKNETRQALEFFIEKAQKLKASRFTQSIIDQGKISLSFTMVKEGLEIEHTIPQGEEIEAFILTFRFFITGRDGISFRSLATGKVMSDPNLSKEWKDELIEARDTLDQFLSTSPLNINAPGICSPTNREIMDVFIYGHLAHADYEKQKTYVLWQSHPLLFPMLKHLFYSVLWTVFICINRISFLSEQELDSLPIQCW